MSSSTIGMDKSSWEEQSTHTHPHTHRELNTNTHLLHPLWHYRHEPYGGVVWPDPKEQSAGCSSERPPWWGVASCCPGTPLGLRGGSYNRLAGGANRHSIECLFLWPSHCCDNTEKACDNLYWAAFLSSGGQEWVHWNIWNGLLIRLFIITGDYPYSC